jgi:hypothetical protein
LEGGQGGEVGQTTRTRKKRTTQWINIQAALVDLQKSGREQLSLEKGSRRLERKKEEGSSTCDVVDYEIGMGEERREADVEVDRSVSWFPDCWLVRNAVPHGRPWAHYVFSGEGGCVRGDG